MTCCHGCESIPRLCPCARFYSVAPEGLHLFGLWKALPSAVEARPCRSVGQGPLSLKQQFFERVRGHLCSTLRICPSWMAPSPLQPDVLKGSRNSTDLPSNCTPRLPAGKGSTHSPPVLIPGCFRLPITPFLSPLHLCSPSQSSRAATCPDYFKAWITGSSFVTPVPP